jgi:hypothetical protein
MEMFSGRSFAAEMAAVFSSSNLLVSEENSNLLHGRVPLDDDPGVAFGDDEDYYGEDEDADADNNRHKKGRGKSSE